jgi:hypothetical protein
MKNIVSNVFWAFHTFFNEFHCVLKPEFWARMLKNTKILTIQTHDFAAIRSHLNGQISMSGEIDL